MNDNNFTPIIIDGCMTNYELNKNGIMRRSDNKHIIQSNKTNFGRNTYTIVGPNDKRIIHTVARWLALTFLPLPYGDDPNAFEADHINGDKTDDRLENIAWLTPRENFIKGLTIDGNFPRGEDTYNAKITNDEALRIIVAINNGENTNEILEKNPDINATPGIISSIRTGKTWGHLSKDFNLERHVIRKEKPYIKHSYDKKSKIRDILIFYGIKTPTRFICVLAELEYNDENKDLINKIRKKLKKENVKYYTIDINL